MGNRDFLGTTPEMEVEYILAQRTRDGLPLLVTAAALPTSVREARPNLLLARLPYRERPNGLPEGDELNRVSRMEDALNVVLVQVGAVHAGHLTGGGQMVAAWYGPSDAPKVVKIRTGLLTRKEVVLDCRSNADWLWYENELALTPLEYESNHNRDLLHKLSEMGDVSQKVRSVDFTFFFNEEARRQAMLDELLTLGYSLGVEGCWTAEGHSQPYGMTVCLETSIEDERIAQLCASLRTCAERHDADFDGWATPVVK